MGINKEYQRFLEFKKEFNEEQHKLLRGLLDKYGYAGSDHCDIKEKWYEYNLYDAIANEIEKMDIVIKYKRR